MEVQKQNLIKYTWGNVSGIDRSKGLFVIKPSGVAYEDLTPDMMVVCDLDGNVVEGNLNPSSDTQTHAVLYKHFDEIGVSFIRIRLGQPFGLRLVWMFRSMEQPTRIHFMEIFHARDS